MRHVTVGSHATPVGQQDRCQTGGRSAANSNLPSRGWSVQQTGRPRLFVATLGGRRRRREQWRWEERPPKLPQPAVKARTSWTTVRVLQRCQAVNR